MTPKRPAWDRRRAKRERIRRDQLTKPARARVGRRPAKERLGMGMARTDNRERRPPARRRTRTPSTEINSDQNEAIPVSPHSTAQVERRNRNFLRNLRKAGSRVLLREEKGEEKEEESSDSEYEEKDNKRSRNKKKPHRQ